MESNSGRSTDHESELVLLQKNLTYLELVNKCCTDKETGLLFFELTRDDLDVTSLLKEQKRSVSEIRYAIVDIR